MEPESLLPGMVRASERVLDHQIRVWEELDDKAEEVMRLGLATLAGAVALATLFVREPGLALDPLFFGLFVTGGAFVVAAVLTVLTSYVGIRADRGVGLGPTPQWTLDRVAAYLGEPLRFHGALLAVYADAFLDNEEKMNLAGRRRLWGIRGLVADVIVLTTAFIYLVGGAIL